MKATLSLHGTWHRATPSMDLYNPEMWYGAQKHRAGLKGSLGGSSYFFHYETIPTFSFPLALPDANPGCISLTQECKHVATEWLG